MCISGNMYVKLGFSGVARMFGMWGNHIFVVNLPTQNSNVAEGGGGGGGDDINCQQVGAASTPAPLGYRMPLLGFLEGVCQQGLKFFGMGMENHNRPSERISVPANFGYYFAL